MQLRELVDLYAQTHEFGIRDSHKKQLIYAVGNYGRFLGRKPTLEQFNDADMTRFVDWLKSHRSLSYARSQRGNLLLLWRYAYEERLCESQPGRVRKVRVPRNNPQCWTPAEIAKLAAAARCQPGQFRGTSIQIAPHLEGFIRAAYETGLRLGDLCEIEPSQLDAQGAAVLRMNKTSYEIVVQLRERTMSLVKQTIGDEPRDRIWCLAPRTYQQWIKRLCNDADVRSGSIKWLRRAAATHVEIESPGDGKRALGHRSDTVAGQSYLDQEQLRRPVPRPPELPDVA